MIREELLVSATVCIVLCCAQVGNAQWMTDYQPESKPTGVLLVQSGTEALSVKTGKVKSILRELKTTEPASRHA